MRQRLGLELAPGLWRGTLHNLLRAFRLLLGVLGVPPGLLAILLGPVGVRWRPCWFSLVSSLGFAGDLVGRLWGSLASLLGMLESVGKVVGIWWWSCWIRVSPS